MSMPQVQTENKIVPLRDNVLVRRDPEPEVTEAGIHLPATKKRAGDVSTGVIVALPTSMDNAMLQIGNRVLFGNFAGTVVDNEDRDLLLMTFDDIRAIVVE